MLSGADKTTCKKFLACKSHMEKAKNKFLERGFSEDKVEFSVRLPRVGIVADIIQEAKAGLYDALIIGKRNLGLFGKMISES